MVPDEGHDAVVRASIRVQLLAVHPTAAEVALEPDAHAAITRDTMTNHSQGRDQRRQQERQGSQVVWQQLPRNARRAHHVRA